MSKRHQVSRRRSYGRRQHELHERMDHLVAVIDWLDESKVRETVHIWDREARVGPHSSGWLSPGGVE